MQISLSMCKAGAIVTLDGSGSQHQYIVLPIKTNLNSSFGNPASIIYGFGLVPNAVLLMSDIGTLSLIPGYTMVTVVG